MSQRTTTTLVENLLGGNWDQTTSVQAYIDTATVMIDRVEACADQKGLDLTAAELELLERWLAAHFYAVNDALYMSRSTDKASGSFQRGPAETGLAETSYGKQVLAMDYSMCLKNLNAQQRAGMAWLGKNPTYQTDYTDRR